MNAAESLGIILMGGTGSRLFPLTAGVNKALLPIYKYSLSQNAVQMFAGSGIQDIIVACNEYDESQLRTHLASVHSQPVLIWGL